ncbi:hypothetical protein EDB84DRAFT_1435090 [Lactarius hengduanensis]|nr:hypothetical protein EDB84DRAFT_1435090 [Lactarius hengduanensis]
MSHEGFCPSGGPSMMELMADHYVRASSLARSGRALAQTGQTFKLQTLSNESGGDKRMIITCFANGSLGGMLPDCLLPPFSSQLDGNVICNVHPEPETSDLGPDESAACDLGLGPPQPVHTAMHLNIALQLPVLRARLPTAATTTQLYLATGQCEPQAGRAPITIASDLAMCNRVQP